MLFAAAAATIGASAQEVLRSPDGELELRFSLSDKGEPTYALDYKGRAVVLPSLLCTAVSTAVGVLLGLLCRRRKEARRA